MQDIINKMRVLIRAGRSEKKVGKDPDRWPFASTWLNQERYNDIEDMAMPSTIKDTRKCECGAPVTVNDKCDKCHDKQDPQVRAHMQWLYSNLEKQGLGIDQFSNRDEWIQACKAHSIPRIKRLLNELHTS